MALLNCSECGNQVNENDSVCQNCGNPLNQNMFNTNTTNVFNQQQEETTTQKLLCSECGNQVNENDSVCQNCGNPLSAFIENEILENVEKIKTTADIVKLFFKILAYISLIVGFISILSGMENGSSYVVLGISCCIMGGILLFVSSIIETFIKWKAYMLETNYKIVKNTECEKNGTNKL